MKLVNIGNRGYLEYETTDRRFHAKWAPRQGARSSYTVTDRGTGKTVRAGTLVEIREAIRAFLADGANNEPGQHVPAAPARNGALTVSRRHADYVYRNADDTVRVRIFRNLGRWDFDVFRPDGSIVNHSSDTTDDFERKVDAKNRAIEIVGSLIPIQVNEVRDGWDNTTGQRKPCTRR